MSARFATLGRTYNTKDLPTGKIGTLQWNCFDGTSEELLILGCQSNEDSFEKLKNQAGAILVAVKTSIYDNTPYLFGDHFGLIYCPHEDLTLQIDLESRLPSRLTKMPRNSALWLSQEGKALLRATNGFAIDMEDLTLLRSSIDPEYSICFESWKLKLGDTNDSLTYWDNGACN